MTFSQYFFNRGLWWYALRQAGWLGILYGLIMIGILPIGLMRADQYSEYLEPMIVNHLFELNGDMQALMIVGFPALVAVFLTRYMQGKQLSDLFHSLPLKRHHLLSIVMVAGSVIVLLPTSIVALIVSLMRPSLERVSISQMQIIEWAASTSILTMLVFACTVVIGVCVGQSILQLLLSAGLLLLPMMLVSLFQDHLQLFLYGYLSSNWDQPEFSMWSPAYRMTQLSYIALQVKEGWIYTVLTLVFMGLAYVLYRLRPAESVSQFVVFRYFNPLFRIAVMLIVSLFTGLIFVHFGLEHPVVAIIGYGVGAIIGSVIAEMVIRKTWQVADLRLLRSTGGYGVLIAIVLWFSVSSLNGYEARIPATADIQGVYMGSDITNDLYTSNRAGNGRNISSIFQTSALSEQPQYVEAIRNLHQQIIANRPNEKYRQQYTPWSSDNQEVQLAYLLKDGSLVKRDYIVPMSSYDRYLEPVVSQAPYKKLYYKWDQLENYEGTITINNADVNWNTPGKRIRDRQDVETLKQIILNNLKQVKNPWADYPRGNSLNFVITVPLDDHGSSTEQVYTVSAEIPELRAWLQEKGLQALPTHVADLKMIQVLPREAGNAHKDEGIPFSQTNKDTVKVTQTDRMQQLLDRSQNYTGRYRDIASTDGYRVQLLFKNGAIAYRILTSEQITPELYSMISR